MELIEDIPVPEAGGSDTPVRRQNDVRVASLFERHDEFGKRLDMSLARLSENEEMMKEIEKLLEEKRAINSADVIAKQKVRWEPDPPDFGEQEELDLEELDYLQYEFGADGEYEYFLPRPCCLKTASLSVCIHMSDASFNHE